MGRKVNACTRSGDADVIAVLRHWIGRSLFEPGNGAMSMILAANPHRVFVSRLERVEVYQPIPAADGKSPDGPHTHGLPRLLRHRRTHAAREFVPAGFLPCAHLYPPHPARDALGHRQPFRLDRHASFQERLARFGEAKLLDVKRRVLDSVALAFAVIAAYATYEIVLFAFTPLLGDAGAFTLAIIVKLGLLNVLWMIGLVTICEIAALAIAVTRRRSFT